MGCDVTWMEHAACVGMPTDLFFDESSARPEVRFAEAAAVCARCPVRNECLDAALPFAHGKIYDSSFRASTTAAERKMIRRGEADRRKVWEKWDRIAEKTSLHMR